MTRRPNRVVRHFLDINPDQPEILPWLRPTAALSRGHHILVVGAGYVFLGIVPLLNKFSVGTTSIPIGLILMLWRHEGYIGFDEFRAAVIRKLPGIEGK